MALYTVKSLVKFQIENLLLHDVLQSFTVAPGKTTRKQSSKGIMHLSFLFSFSNSYPVYVLEKDGDG